MNNFIPLGGYFIWKAEFLFLNPVNYLQGLLKHLLYLKFTQEYPWCVHGSLRGTIQGPCRAMGCWWFGIKHGEFLSSESAANQWAKFVWCRVRKQEFE